MKHRFTGLFVLFLLAASLGGCNAQKAEIRKVIAQNLEPLKELDESTIREYISTEELFPDIAKDDTQQELTSDFITGFFENFDYQILHIRTEDEEASASLRLYTLDARSLACDFHRASLRDQILNAAQTEGSELSGTTSLEENIQILNELIQKNDYETTETDCTMELYRSGDTWKVEHTSDLENQITGGFVSSISDPELLSPSETLDVYLSVLQEMDETQLTNYLGIASLLDTEDNMVDQFAAALVSQVISCYDYEILDTQQSEYTAIVHVRITTFDSDAIISRYDELLDDYLDTPQAVYDGSGGRLNQSYSLMLSCIQENEETTELEIPIAMTNDGASWKPDNANIIGNSLFGSLTETLNSYDSDSDDDSDYDS